MKLPGVADKVNFYIVCMFSPTIETLCNAIEAGNLQSFPGHLTSAQVRKHDIRSAAMLGGHQDQLRKGLNSTSKPQKTTDANPQQEENKHEMYCAMYVEEGQVYTDQTGRFLTPATEAPNIYSSSTTKTVTTYMQKEYQTG